MVVDTAAQTGFVVKALADELQLEPLKDGATINGVTGSAHVDAYRIGRLGGASFGITDATLMTLPNVGSTGAKGIIGMDPFLDRKLVFDIAARRFQVLPSGGTLPGFVAHAGRTLADNFIFVPIRLNGVTVQALVDSGAARSVANAATLRAMGWAAGDPRLKAGGEIRGATDTPSPVRLGTIETIALGPVSFSNVEMIFSDQSPVDGLGLGDGPAMILGADLLNLLQAYAVDFRRGTLEIRVPHVPR
jgi:hypothetical protein